MARGSSLSGAMGRWPSTFTSTQTARRPPPTPQALASARQTQAMRAADPNYQTGREQAMAQVRAMETPNDPSFMPFYNSDQNSYWRSQLNSGHQYEGQNWRGDYVPAGSLLNIANGVSTHGLVNFRPVAGSAPGAQSALDALNSTWNNNATNYMSMSRGTMGDYLNKVLGVDLTPGQAQPFTPPAGVGQVRPTTFLYEPRKLVSGDAQLGAAEQKWNPYMYEKKGYGVPLTQEGQQWTNYVKKVNADSSWNPLASMLGGIASMALGLGPVGSALMGAGTNAISGGNPGLGALTGALGPAIR